MNVLTIFEQRIGTIFMTNAPSEKKPISFKRLAKRAVREMEDETFVIDGVDTAPALYTILVSPQDDMVMRPMYIEITEEISQLIEAQAKKRGYTFVGKPLARFMVDPALRNGKFSVFAENIDPRTLARLRDEENAYLGLSPAYETYGEQEFAPEPSPVVEPEPAFADEPFGAEQFEAEQLEMESFEAGQPEDAQREDASELEEQPFEAAIVAEQESEIEIDDTDLSEFDSADEAGSDLFGDLADEEIVPAEDELATPSEAVEDHANDFWSAAGEDVPAEPMDDLAYELTDDSADDSSSQDEAATESDKPEPMEAVVEFDGAASPAPEPEIPSFLTQNGEEDEEEPAPRKAPAHVRQDVEAEPEVVATPAVPPFIPTAASVASVPSPVAEDDMPAASPVPEREDARTIPAIDPEPQASAPRTALPVCSLTDKQTGKVYRVTTSRTLIGRERTSGGVVLTDPNVSRQHAELTFDGSTWQINDLHSTNGTLVNGVDVPAAKLTSGDVLTLGITELEFRAG